MDHGPDGRLKIEVALRRSADMPLAKLGARLVAGLFGSFAVSLVYGLSQRSVDVPVCKACRRHSVMPIAIVVVSLLAGMAVFFTALMTVGRAGDTPAEVKAAMDRGLLVGAVGGILTAVVPAVLGIFFLFPMKARCVSRWGTGPVRVSSTGDDRLSFNFAHADYQEEFAKANSGAPPSAAGGVAAIAPQPPSVPSRAPRVAALVACACVTAGGIVLVATYEPTIPAPATPPPAASPAPPQAPPIDVKELAGAWEEDIDLTVERNEPPGTREDKMKSDKVQRRNSMGGAHVRYDFEENGTVRKSIVTTGGSQAVSCTFRFEGPVIIITGATPAPSRYIAKIDGDLLSLDTAYGHVTWLRRVHH
jgi:hypothetical protein